MASLLDAANKKTHHNAPYVVRYYELEALKTAHPDVVALAYRVAATRLRENANNREWEASHAREVADRAVKAATAAEEEAAAAEATGEETGRGVAAPVAGSSSSSVMG